MSNLGTIAFGIRGPIIRNGDNLENIVVDCVKSAVVESGIKPHNGDIIGITESVVARSQGNYVTVDEIAEETKRLFGENAEITIVNPIYSRNRFAMCLKGIARAAKKINLVMPSFDEVGNPGWCEHPFTQCVYKEYYREICQSENAECEIRMSDISDFSMKNVLIASIHTRNELKHKFSEMVEGEVIHTLCDYFPDKCEYGLLGSNKANEELVKLFPNVRKARQLVYRIQERLEEFFDVNLEVFINGDGAFKSPYNQGVSIWELADPVVCPAYTAGLEGMPNELKLKYLADCEFEDLTGDELKDKIKEKIAKKSDESLIGNMDNEGCTPRNKTWLLGSCADLLTGSGDKGCPFVYFHDYEKDYSRD